MPDSRTIPYSAAPATSTRKAVPEPGLPDNRVAIVYTTPDAGRPVRYVTTDENGCFTDTIGMGVAGLWKTQAVLEESDCVEEATSPPQHLDVTPSLCGGSTLCCILWVLLLLALITTILWFFRWRCAIPSARQPFLLALALTLLLGWLMIMITRCDVNPCRLWLSTALASIMALLIVIYSKKVFPSMFPPPPSRPNS